MVLPFLTAIAPFAPLIGGAISAVGALMAPKPKPQTITNTIDIQKLRDDAEAAGFNPLTIIRGGGLAGYGSQHLPAAADTRFSDALMTFGSGVSQWQYDPYGQRRSQVEIELAEAQIAELGRRGTAPSNLSFQTPKAVGDPYTVFGIDWQPSPWFSNAQEIEDRHGDLAGSIYGFMSIPADVLHTGWQALTSSPGWKEAVERGRQRREAWGGNGMGVNPGGVTITIPGGVK